MAKYCKRGSQNNKLKTVTYGTALVSFLAVRCLHQVQAVHKYPIDTGKIFKDFYIDDLLTEKDSQEEAHCIKHKIVTILAAGDFSIQKWTSNDNSFLHDIPRRCETSLG